ncbi:MAG: TadE/TadG family type IV pilus assembly protein [Humidesulfovibrio sp.]|nr:TadE family protein [Desulfovibrio sp.]MDO9083443.1 TadE/TadG family type IV pilus assembly protein [Humidesulfovibrio sp.]
MHATQRNRRVRNQSGSISVESALLLPMLMLLMLAFVDFGRLMWTQTVLNSAAAEAARLAVLPEPSDSAVAASAVKRVTDGGIRTVPAVVVGARTANQPVSVTVSVGFDFLVLSDLMPEILGHRTLSSTSVMVHQP